jgi:hypothetical protein
MHLPPLQIPEQQSPGVSHEPNGPLHDASGAPSIALPSAL